ncbi:MAG TPA: hypothetical protein VK249_34175 [Anaerolineales bacterium]|nr:hypothetical protein [Anaerolineales bacterium]
MNKTVDRLYKLLPAIHRIRDAERGYPLRALLGVIAEQVNLIEDDISQLYENWFIETCQDWVVPYIGELIGYQLIHEAGEPGDVNTVQGLARNKILIPRRDVADAIHNRRRKGTLALLEELAADVTGWSTRAVEFFKLLAWTQNINHLHLDRAQTVDLRNGDALDLLDSPFDSIAHTVDIRRINSPRTIGHYNIPSVGLFVWRNKVYSVTQTPACHLEEIGPYCYTFSVLGNNTPLHVHPQSEDEPAHIAEELNLPVPIRRREFEQHIVDYYGEGKSISIFADWANLDPAKPIPLNHIIAVDLSDWEAYQPKEGYVAVDPALGRIVFPPSQLPKAETEVHVSYYYGFSADIGGGEYDRSLSRPAATELIRVSDPNQLQEAIAPWTPKTGDDPLSSQPRSAVIEITNSGLYEQPFRIKLNEGCRLQIRAANRKRPVIRLPDRRAGLSDALSVTMGRDSRFTLDGLLIAGRSVQIKATEEMQAQAETCPAEVIIRHCTLVPGWGLDADCNPKLPSKPSLELFNVRARVRIEHSIIGSIQVHENQVMADPIPVQIIDSILDATSDKGEALGAPGYKPAYVMLTIKRSTVFGIVEVHAIELAENCIFTSCLNVARRQLGCMRFCYVPPGCRTPRRYNGQPDMVEQAAEASVRAKAKKTTPQPDNDTLKADIEFARLFERIRVRPQFNSVRYGEPAYCHLAETCAVEIQRGADDESEMGVFHDLFNPQREANLRARLAEYTPASTDAGIIYAS